MALLNGRAARVPTQTCNVTVFEDLLRAWEVPTMRDAIPLAVAIVGMGVAMWVLHRVVEL